MTTTIHRVTTKQFVRALMRECRRRRKMDFKLGGLLRLTQHDLADVSGYNYRYVHEWERGRRQPSLTQALDCLQAVSQ